MRQPRWSTVPYIHDARCAAAAPCASRGGPPSPSSPHPRRPAGRLRSHRSEMSCSVGGERAAARVVPHVEGVPCGAVSGADTGSGRRGGGRPTWSRTPRRAASGGPGRRGGGRPTWSASRRTRAGATPWWRPASSSWLVGIIPSPPPSIVVRVEQRRREREGIRRREREGFHGPI